MTSADRRTLDIYDTRASEYAAKFDTAKVSPWVQGMIDALPTGSHVLDLGCGMGRVSAQLIGAGFNVDAVDASAGMATEAKARFGIDVRIAEFHEISGDHLYDGVLAQFSLLHAQRKDLPDLFSRIHAALKPGGRFVIGMKLGTGEARDKLGRFYTYVTEEELAALFAHAGFVVIDTLRGEDEGFDGSVDPWIVVTTHA